MDVLFASDLHLGHENALKWRKRFSTVEEHDLFITASLVGAGGTRKDLYLLGDLCWTVDSVQYLKQIVEAYNNVYFLLGNHDLERVKGRPSINEILSTGAQLISSGKYKEFWLSHEPIHPLELRGKVNIHGHIHENHLPEEYSKDYFNVCIETIDYIPINLNTIRRKLSNDKY